MDKICLAGSGWGSIAAFKALSAYFNVIELVTKDVDLLKIKRDSDIQLEDIYSVDSKYIICAGYSPIIKKDLIEIKTIINIHYSLLPKYRGIHSTVWAILNDEEYLGLTIHLINEKLDDGPIIHQYKMINDKVSTATYYMELFNNWISSNLGKIIVGVIKNGVTLKHQNINDATWVGKRSFEDCKIDFSRSHLYIKNFFRALNYPYPRPFFRIKGKKECYIVSGVTYLNRDINIPIGRILNIDNNGIYVSSSEGYLILSGLTDLQGNRIDYSFFKNGMYLD